MSRLDQAARAFGDVREGEAPRALLLAAGSFLLLSAYYLLKVVREPLILTTGGRALKAYGTVAQAGVLMLAVPFYGWLTSRVGRDKLVRVVVFFFLACIQLFCVAAWLGVPLLGFAFYVWVGIFSLSMIAQFGSFVNDVYAKDEGERLFPLIWIGSTLGAALGSYLASGALKALGVIGTLELVSGLLILHYAVFARVQAQVGGGRAAIAPAHDRGPRAALSLSFGLVLRSPYLRLVAGVLLLLNLVNTTGELVLSGLVRDAAQAAAQRALPPGAEPAAVEGFVGAYIGDFYGRFYLAVNVVVVVVQALLVSRLVRWLGFAGALLLLPLISLGAYAWVGLGAGLAVFQVVKAAENAADYSVMNTARAMLWLPTRREEKFGAKQLLDSFFVRVGDLMAGGVVLLLQLSNRQFAWLNVGAASLWLLLGVGVVRRYRAMVPARGR